MRRSEHPPLSKADPIIEERSVSQRPEPMVVITSGQRFQAAIIDAGLVEFMKKNLPSQSKECIMDNLGISANTWQKIKHGKPIRRSTAEVLLARLSRRMGGL
jgi:hypothetical protein